MRRAKKNKPDGHKNPDPMVYAPVSSDNPGARDAIRALGWTQEPSLDLVNSMPRWRVLSPVRGGVHVAVGTWLLIEVLTSKPTLGAVPGSVLAVLVLYGASTLSAATALAVRLFRRPSQPRARTHVLVIAGITVLMAHLAWWMQLLASTKATPATLPRAALAAACASSLTWAIVRMCATASTTYDTLSTCAYVSEAVACMVALVAYEWVAMLARADAPGSGARACHVDANLETIFRDNLGEAGVLAGAWGLLDLDRMTNTLNSLSPDLFGTSRKFTDTFSAPLQVAASLVSLSLVLRGFVLWGVFAGDDPADWIARTKVYTRVPGARDENKGEFRPVGSTPKPSAPPRDLLDEVTSKSHKLEAHDDPPSYTLINSRPVDIIRPVQDAPVKEPKPTAHEQLGYDSRRQVAFVRRTEGSKDEDESAVALKWAKREVLVRQLVLPGCALALLLLAATAHVDRMQYAPHWLSRPCAPFNARSVAYFEHLGRELDRDCAEVVPASKVRPLPARPAGGADPVSRAGVRRVPTRRLRVVHARRGHDGHELHRAGAESVVRARRRRVPRRGVQAAQARVRGRMRLFRDGVYL